MPHPAVAELVNASFGRIKIYSESGSDTRDLVPDQQSLPIAAQAE